MMDHLKKRCSICAWRATCQMRFKGDGSGRIALNCPEFTFDESLRNKMESTENSKPDSTSGKRGEESTIFGENAYKPPVKRYFDPDEDLPQNEQNDHDDGTSR